MKSGYRATFALCAGLLLLCSCRFEFGRYADNLAAAVAGAAQFRRLYNERRFAEIYDWATAAQQYQSRDDFVSSLQKTYNTLGAFKTGSLAASGCFPNQVRLVYHAEFEKGKVTEAMTWAVYRGAVSFLAYEYGPGHAEVKNDPRTTCVR